MVIINYKGGQLANRIYLFSHFIANSIENKYALYNPEFDEYLPYFEATSKNNFNGLPISTTLFKNHFADRVFSRIFRLWTDITHKIISNNRFYTLYRIFKTYDIQTDNFNLYDPTFLEAACNKKVIVQGWTFRDHPSLLKHSETIRQFFKPIEKYRIEVAKEIKAANALADVIIGVHIRRGDYIRYNGGIWFYDNAVYSAKMLQVQQQMNQLGKTCAFIICSNDKIDVEQFSTELKILTGNRHFMVDLYLLASCDGIIGPPSTFSQWASFYGKVPLTFIFNPEDLIQIGTYEHVDNP